MTNKEILEKAIKKVQQNGWNDDGYLRINFFSCPNYKINGMEIWDGNPYGEHSSLRDIIFSHDFAKAFWGIGFINTDYSDLEEWQYHLSKMVLEKEPLKYLEKFL